MPQSGLIQHGSLWPDHVGRGLSPRFTVGNAVSGTPCAGHSSLWGVEGTRENQVLGSLHLALTSCLTQGITDASSEETREFLLSLHPHPRGQVSV